MNAPSSRRPGLAQPRGCAALPRGSGDSKLGVPITFNDFCIALSTRPEISAAFNSSSTPNASMMASPSDGSPGGCRVSPPFPWKTRVVAEHVAHTRACGGGTHGWHRRAPRAWHTRLGAADVAARRAGTLSKSFTAASAQPQGRDFTAPTLRTGTTALPSQTSEKEKVGRAWQPHRHPCATNAFLPWSAMRASSASPPPTLS